MVCLEAKELEHLDLIIVDKINQIKLAGYELKTNNVTKADLRKSFIQAKGYADFYKIKVHLINFCLQGLVDETENAPHNVSLVNAVHSADCTQFSVSSIGWGEKSVTVVMEA
jgi:hypothetical protein